MSCCLCVAVGNEKLLFVTGSEKFDRAQRRPKVVGSQSNGAKERLRNLRKLGKFATPSFQTEIKDIEDIAGALPRAFPGRNYSLTPEFPTSVSVSQISSQGDEIGRQWIEKSQAVDNCLSCGCCYSYRKGAKKARCTTLSGSHGEWTDTDDVKKNKAGKALKGLGIGLARNALKAAGGAAPKSTGNPAMIAASIAADVATKMVDKKLAKEQRKLKGQGNYSFGRRVTGRGSYDIHSQNTGGDIRTPIIMGGGDEEGSTIVSKTDFLDNVFAPADSGFHNKGYSVNVGLSQFFLFLSQIATNYTVYELLQCVIEYIPQINMASTSGQVPLIMMAMNYNAGEPIYGSQAEMMESPSEVDGRASVGLLVGIECDTTKFGGSRTHYVRAGAVPDGQDIKTYDYGTFQVAISGSNSAVYTPGTILGYMRISYKVRLGKPRLYDAVGKTILFDRFAASAGSGLTSGAPLGATPQANPNNSLGGSLTSAGVYTLPDQFSGTILICYIWSGTSASSFGLTATGTVAGPTLDYEVSSEWTPINSILAYQAGNNTVYMGLFSFQRPNTSGANTVTVSVTGMTGGVSAQLFITQWNPLATGPSTGYS